MKEAGEGKGRDVTSAAKRSSEIVRRYFDQRGLVIVTKKPETKKSDAAEARRLLLR